MTIAAEIQILDLFLLASLILVVAYYLHPTDARAIFLQTDLLCNGTCSITGGGTSGKNPRFFTQSTINCDAIQNLLFVETCVVLRDESEK